MPSSMSIRYVETEFNSSLRERIEQIIKDRAAEEANQFIINLDTYDDTLWVTVYNSSSLKEYDIEIKASKPTIVAFMKQLLSQIYNIN